MDGKKVSRQCENEIENVPHPSSLPEWHVPSCDPET
jgi:hypothetical protein